MKKTFLPWYRDSRGWHFSSNDLNQATVVCEQSSNGDMKELDQETGFLDDISSYVGRSNYLKGWLPPHIRENLQICLQDAY